MALMFLLEGEIQKLYLALYIYIFMYVFECGFIHAKFSNCADSQEFLMLYVTGKVNLVTRFASQRDNHVFQISF